MTIETDPGDVPIYSVWNTFTAALAAKDTSAALAQMSKEGQFNYAPLLADIVDDLPAAVSTFSPLYRIDFSDNYSEYGLWRMVDGVRRVFIVTFIRNDAGTWQIASM